MKKKLIFIGPVLTASGYGVHSRQLLKALNDSGDFDLAVESIRWGDTPYLQDEGLEWIRKLTGKKHSNPDVAVHVSIPNEFVRRAPLTIGVTAGIEVDRVAPEWLLKCNSEVDIVVVPSEHSKNAFIVEYAGSNGEKLHLEKPIFVVPEGVDTDIFKPLADANGELLDNLGAPNKNFVFVGLGLDKPNGRDRKNVTTLIEWFCSTFAGNAGVGLVLKTSIVNGSSVDFDVTRKRIVDIKTSTGCGEFPKVFLVHGRMTEQEMAGLYNDKRVIAAVSLTHGEGFGLPLIEAAACGLPVMATDWSGHLDFLTKNGKKLFIPVDYDLNEIHAENVWQGVMNAGSRWAMPQETDATNKMRKLMLSSSTPRKWAAELVEHIQSEFSLTATGKVFVDLVNRSAKQMALVKPSSRSDLIAALRSKVRDRGKSVIYTMPMSAGDVFLSTAVIDLLKKKHENHVVYFATQPQYFSIVGGLVDEIIEWQPWMQDISVLEDVFDEVYTPNLAIQMSSSNWVHRGNGRNLVEEMAVQCGLDADDLLFPRMKESESTVDLSPLEAGAWVAVHTGGQKSARAYSYWTEVVNNLRSAGLKIVQVGASDDISAGEVDLSMQTIPYTDLPNVLTKCKAFVGIDSFPMHVADAYGIPTVAIFGSSYAKSTGPRDYPGRSELPVLIETSNRNGCERACYKDVCKVDAVNPCINNISALDIYNSVLLLCGYETAHEYVKYIPKIAGYTHLLNPQEHGYPYTQSITSMLGFCDEVIVVDGGSSDGSLDTLSEIFAECITSGKLKIINRTWDYEEPGMDGMQKAFGRAMVSPEMEFLWQQDADEVVHEKDYKKILDMCKRFPDDVDVLHLPVIELWADSKRVRTDRHSWKWRLSRNNLRVTHGINSNARVMDHKTGRFYAKPGMSDGCEMIDIVTGDHLPHRGFYSDSLEHLRKEDPAEYGRQMNEIFKAVPSVWHYSWSDLERKVRNFRDFWDKQWQVLYQTPPQARFPDVVTDDDVIQKAKELASRGGEHGEAVTFTVELEQPLVMKE